MRLNDAYPNKWLKAEDLEEDLTVTISNVSYQDFVDPKTQNIDRKPAMFFEGEDTKPMILNKTNFKTIAQVLRSDDTDDWIGSQITLFATEVEAFGEMTLGIRVRLKAPTAKAKAASAKTTAKSESQARKNALKTPDEIAAEAPDAEDLPF